MPTSPFLAEALVAMSTCLMLLVSVTLSPVSTSAAASLSESYFTTMCLCHGGSAYGSIVSIRAITPSWASANFVNGDKYLRVSLTLSVASGTIATHFDLAFYRGQRSAFTQPDFSETSRFGSNILGPGLPSMGNTSGDSVTPLQQSTPAKLDPSRRYPSEDELEVKRQSERWRRDLRLAKRLHYVRGTSFHESQRPVLELPNAITTGNIPTDTNYMPVALTSSTSSTLSSSNYLQSHNAAILEYQQPQLAAVPLITCPQSLQASYNVSNNYAAAYARFNQSGFAANLNTLDYQS
ncbi:hypothetical protein FOQG_18362 [Fusarium oxysporum f. sp. raphani 54005]|uniref:Uncharacterized protein n=1 Tax=Fusarium oxysporum f. sp. raphani 54005 TaxID=1089458 RepID=X0BEJ2_FUSOX|nr:hypothetical protein FOQG_18362 [Fusarium oxysporum f. sp. raphani 54005]